MEFRYAGALWPAERGDRGAYRLQRGGGGLLIPKYRSLVSFTAHEDGAPHGDTGRFLVSLTVSASDGAPVVHNVTVDTATRGGVTRAYLDALPLTRLAARGVACTSLTPALDRAYTLDRRLLLAGQRAGMPVSFGMPPQPVLVDPHGRPWYPVTLDDGPKRQSLEGSPRRRKITPEFLREVADTYLQAVTAGEPPTRAVSAAFGHPPRPTVERWIHRAREAGHLPRYTTSATGTTGDGT